MATEHIQTIATAGPIDQLLFGVYPYIALTVLAIGSVLRFDREQYSWRSSSSQFLRRKQLIWGSVLFHIGVIIIFFGHVVGLLTPLKAFELFRITHGAKQILAMGVGGFAAVFALAGGLMLLHRRLFDPRIRKTSNFSDIAILALLVIQLILGLATIPFSGQHLDGSEMVKFMSWSQRIFTLRPGAANHIADVHWIFKLHITLGLTIFLVFPFTRLVHMLSAPIWYLPRRGWQIVRTRRDMAARKSGGRS